MRSKASRILSKLNEMWVTNTSNIGSKGLFKVYLNPTASDLNEIIIDTKDRDIRFVIDSTTSECYVFSYNLIHYSVITAENLNPKIVYSGRGKISNGKIWIYTNYDINFKLSDNPRYNYAKEYFRDPEIAFQSLKSNCSYLSKNTLFIEESVDLLLKDELRRLFK